MPKKKRKKNTGWGGKRPGAGRRLEMEDCRQLSVHMPARAVAQLQEEATRAKLSLSKYARGILMAVRPDLPWGIDDEASV